MNIRFGILHTGKEIDVDLGEDAKAEDIKKDIDKQLGGEGNVWLTDIKGRSVGIPIKNIAYVEVGADGAEPRIGFSLV